MRELVVEILNERLQNTHLFIAELNVTPHRIDVQVDGDMGVNINECVQLSRHLQLQLTERGIDAGNFNIEVSSPGFDRKILTQREYIKNVGRTLQIRDKGQKYHKGILAYVDENQIALSGGKNKKKLQYFSFENILDANVTI